VNSLPWLVDKGLPLALLVLPGVLVLHGGSALLHSGAPRSMKVLGLSAVASGVASLVMVVVPDAPLTPAWQALHALGQVVMVWSMGQMVASYGKSQVAHSLKITQIRPDQVASEAKRGGRAW